MIEKKNPTRKLVPLGELELGLMETSQMEGEDDIMRIARAALEPYLPSWKLNPFTRGVFDYRIRKVLPILFDEDTHSYDPNKQALYDAACTVLKKEGFVAVGGRWYVPEQKLK